MGLQLLRGRADLARNGLLMCVCIAAALACANYVPTISAQKAVDLSVAYSLPQGFFILNVLDNGVLGANNSWSLSGGVSYAKALVNTDYYLFNVTYNRTSSAPGGNRPPNFNSSQYFEVNLLSTLSTRFLQWNAYGYGDQVDLWPLQSGTAELNALYAFDMVDVANKIHVIRWYLNASLCVATTGGGVDFVLKPCQTGNAAQQYQLIDAFSPNPPIPVAGTVVDVSAAYFLPKGFFVSNVLDNTVLGANQTWSLTGALPYAKAVLSSEYFLFNMTYNRSSVASGGIVPPNFDSSQYFEINLLSTLSTRFLQWNVYGHVDQVDLYPPQQYTAELNALFAFILVDDAQKVYVIRTRLNAGSCVSTTGGGVDFVLKPCQLGNTAQRFQLINPFSDVDPSPSSASNFFSTAGGVIVILLIIGVAFGGAYAGWRVWKKRSQSGKHIVKSGTSEPALLTALDPSGTEEETQGSYRKIGDNMELANSHENNGHSTGGGRESKRGTTSPNDY